MTSIAHDHRTNSPATHPRPGKIAYDWPQIVTLSLSFPPRPQTLSPKDFSNTIVSKYVVPCSSRARNSDFS